MPASSKSIFWRDAEAAPAPQADPYPDRLRAAFVTSLVAMATGIPAREIAGSTRARAPAARARQMAMYLTHVDTVVEDADAFFPGFDPDDWQVLARDARAADARHASGFEFVDYRRRVAPTGP